MTEQTTQTFAQMMDRSHLDRLQGEILVFVSDFEEQGYSNMDVARQLILAAFKRADRENLSVRESFYQYMRDVCIRYLAGLEEIHDEIAARIKKGN